MVERPNPNPGYTPKPGKKGMPKPPKPQPPTCRKVAPGKGGNRCQQSRGWLGCWCKVEGHWVPWCAGRQDCKYNAPSNCWVLLQLPKMPQQATRAAARPKAAAMRAGLQLSQPHEHR